MSRKCAAGRETSSFQVEAKFVEFCEGNATGWHELKVHGCDGRTFWVFGEVREPSLELPQVQSAIHRALEEPPAVFPDSYLRGRFSSLRQLEGSPPDLCDVPAFRRDLPHVLVWKVLGL